MLSSLTGFFNSGLQRWSKLTIHCNIVQTINLISIMKNSIDNRQEELTAVQNEPCSEKKCVSCFANRGCMYEQAHLATIPDAEIFHWKNETVPYVPVSKRA
ncbi:MAG: hypothetical protein JNN00_03070 [Chitinophagaceae bacterium]|nr:hypothetical protein [Chitinophagaceae bacterium]